MVVLPFTSMCYIHGWGNDREQCLFYSGHLFVQSRWVWPPLGCSHGSSFFLVVWSQLVRDSSIYCLLALLIRSDSLPLKLASYGVACHDFIHSLLWSSTLVFQSDVLMIIVYDVNNHIIVQSKIVLTACEVVNMFLFIIGLWSLSLTVASDVKLRTVVSEHWPYSQRLYCQTLCLSVIVFASLFSLTFEYNYVHCCSSSSGGIQQRSLFSWFRSSSKLRFVSSVNKEWTTMF